MITPLAWTDLGSLVVIVLPITLMMALVDVFIIRRKQVRNKLQGLSASLFVFMKFGSLFSIFGIVQALYFHGAISLELEFFVMGLAVVCSISSAMCMRIIDSVPKTP